MPDIKLEIGTKFKEYYNPNNINNIPYYEVRGIVDETQVILLGCTQKGKWFYNMIDIGTWNFRIKNNLFHRLSNDELKLYEDN